MRALKKEVNNGTRTRNKWCPEERRKKTWGFCLRKMEGTGCEKIVNGLQNDEREKKCNRKELHKKEIVKGKAGRWKVSGTLTC